VTTLSLPDREVEVYYPARAGSTKGRPTATYTQTDPIPPEILAGLPKVPAGVDLTVKIPATRAGIAAIEVAKENGSWSALDAVERLEEPPDLAAALDADAAARENWSGFSPSSRKGILWWVVSAKKEETKERRLATLIATSAAGRRIDFMGPKKG